MEEETRGETKASVELLKPKHALKAGRFIAMYAWHHLTGSPLRKQLILKLCHSATLRTFHCFLLQKFHMYWLINCWKSHHLPSKILVCFVNDKGSSEPEKGNNASRFQSSWRYQGVSSVLQPATDSSAAGDKDRNSMMSRWCIKRWTETSVDKWSKSNWTEWWVCILNDKQAGIRLIERTTSFVFTLESQSAMDKWLLGSGLDPNQTIPSHSLSPEQETMLSFLSAVCNYFRTQEGYKTKQTGMHTSRSPENSVNATSAHTECAFAANLTYMLTSTQCKNILKYRC